ncbi:MAG: glycosyltransferase family 39 protein [Bacteroidota bacterium]|nr:glycosyltransferase family 39 protein [Bacteroidota bacterium]
MNKFHFFVFGSFVVNLIIKLYKIDHSAFSYDEIISVKDTLLDFGHIKHESEWDSNPPFYYYCLWVWEKIFGLSEVGIRSFSAFFNSAAIITFGYYLYRDFNKNISVFFILIFTFHPTLLFYAQEARCYSLLLFLTSVSIIIFNNFILRNSMKNLIWLSLINFLLIYTHYLAAFILFFQFLFILFYFRQHFIKFFLSNLVVLVLVLLRFTKKQYLLIFGITSDSNKETWIKKATLLDLANFCNEMYFHYIFFVALLITVCYFLHKNKEKEKIIYYIIFVSFLTPVIFYLVGKYVPIFINRYILFSVVFTLILVSYIIYYTGKSGYILLSLVVGVEMINLDFGETKGSDFRSVANFVHKIKQKPLVIINKKDITELFTYYYDVNLFEKVSRKDKTELNQRNIYDANSVEDLEKINIDQQKVVLLFQNFDTEKANKEIYDWFINHHYKMEKYSIFTGIKFTLFKK